MLFKRKNLQHERWLPPWLWCDLALILAILVIAEIILQLHSPFYRYQLFDNDFTGSYPMDVNADDYRGRLVGKDKPAGTLRIVALGDSTTFGTGMPADGTWSYRLQAGLQAVSGAKVDVINGGVEGASLGDIRRSVQEKWAAYHPDVVIVALTGNMISLEVVRPTRSFLPKEHFDELRQPQPWATRLLLELSRYGHRLCLPSFLSMRSREVLYWTGVMGHELDPQAPYGSLLAYGMRQGDLDPAVAEQAWARLGQDLRELKTTTDAMGAKLVLTFIEPRFRLSSTLADNTKNVPVERLSIDAGARAHVVADQLGVLFVDATAALLAERAQTQVRELRLEALYLPFDYAHLNAYGHAGLAAAFVSLLGSPLPAPAAHP